MSLIHSRRGRPVLACDCAGCKERFRVRRRGETIVELRLRATINGWRRVVRLEICPRHATTFSVQADRLRSVS